MSRVENTDAGDKFQAALDRLDGHLRERCESAKALTESLIDDDNPRSERAARQFLEMAEEYNAFNKLLELVSVMANDLNEIVEREKSNATAGSKIEVVEMPGAAGRSSGRGTN